MTLRVPVMIGNLPDWGRKVATTVNQIITNLGDYLPLTGGTLTGDLSVPDEAYGVGWNGSLEVPTKNALYDKIETLASSGVPDGDKGDIVVSSSGTVWNFDSSVVTAFAKTFLDDADAASVRTTIGAQASGSYLVTTNNLSDLANAGTARTNLGLGTIATQDASNVSITGGSVTGITDLAVADGGTGASSASAARTNLGLVIGTDVQAYNTNLAGLAGLTLSQGDILYRDGSGLQRLAAGTSGQLLKTNGTGANPAWASVGTSYEAGPITPATTSDLATWRNQGTSSVSDGTGAMILTPQADGLVHGREKTAPSAPYDIYCRVEPVLMTDAGVTTQLDSTSGIMLANNSSGKIITFGAYFQRVSGDEQNLTAVQLARWTNATTFSANLTILYMPFLPKWLRLNVTSTTITAYVSADGKNWAQVPTTETIATFMSSVDRIGVYAASDTDNDVSSVLFSYFSTTAPA